MDIGQGIVMWPSSVATTLGDESYGEGVLRPRMIATKSVDAVSVRSEQRNKKRTHRQCSVVILLCWRRSGGSEEDGWNVLWVPDVGQCLDGVVLLMGLVVHEIPPS